MDEATRLEIQAWLVKAQQAAEKTLKAYLTWRDEPFEKTHSLVALVSKCLPSIHRSHRFDKPL
jgi:HEPN domain-containing protein